MDYVRCIVRIFVITFLMNMSRPLLFTLLDLCVTPTMVLHYRSTTKGAAPYIWAANTCERIIDARLKQYVIKYMYELASI